MVRVIACVLSKVSNSFSKHISRVYNSYVKKENKISHTVNYKITTRALIGGEAWFHESIETWLSEEKVHEL